MKAKFGGRQVLYVIALTAFIAITYGFGKYIFFTITPDIVSGLGLSYGFMGIINAGVALTASIASLMGGFVSAKFGAKRVVTTSVILSALFMISLFFCHNRWMLLVYAIAAVAVVGLLLLHGAFFVVLCCGLFGLAYYDIFGLHATYVSNIVPPEKTAQLFGFVNVAVGLGAVRDDKGAAKAGKGKRSDGVI